MTNRELLDKAIDSCEKLKNIEYHITIGKSNKETQIVLIFPIDRFHHMIGFHKIKDVNFLNKNERSRERIYKTVLKNIGDLRDKIANSHFINDTNIRLEAIIKLEAMLDANKETYYTKSNYYSNFGNINNDFAMHVKDDNCYVSFYFIKEIESSMQNRYVIVSTFENDEPKGHCRKPQTLLKKIKINKTSKESKILFDFRKN